MSCLYQISPPQPLPTSLSLFFLLICISIPLFEPTPTIVYQFHWFFTFLLSFLFSFLPLHPKISSYAVGASETQQLQLKPNSFHEDLMLCNCFFFNKVFFEFVLDPYTLFFSFFFYSPISFLNFILFFFSFSLFLLSRSMVWYFNGDFKLLI